MARKIMFLAAVALVALAGVAYAAGSITGKSIKDNSITGKDIKNKSLTRKDFKGSVRGPQGDRGPTGATGPAGPAGAQGPPGPSTLSTLSPVFGSITIAADDFDGGTVACPSGQRVVSGGFFVDGNDVEVFLSEANDDRTGWVVAADNLGSANPAELEGVAYCAGSGQAVAARMTTNKLKPLRGRTLRKLKAYAAKRGLTLTRR
jgi:hypothetical protein